MIASASRREESRWRTFLGNRPSAAATEVTVSATAISSNTGSANTEAASPINRPCVAAAKIRVAPASRQRRAARCRVPPVLIRSSKMTACRALTWIERSYVEDTARGDHCAVRDMIACAAEPLAACS